MKEEKQVPVVEEDLSVKDWLKKISEQLNKSPETKKWKMPWSGKLSKGKAKNGWVTIIHIKDNRNLEFMKVPLDEQTATIDGCPRIVTPDDVLYHKGKPVVIFPSWSVKPISVTSNYDETIKEKYRSTGYKLLLNKMKKEVIENKKSISGGLIFGIIAVVIAAGYFAYKGGLLG